MQTIYATFHTLEDAERAYAALADHGINEEHITVLAQTPTAAGTPGDTAEKIERTAENGITTTSLADAAEAAKPGAAIGLGLGTLAALTSLAIPGVGLVIGGGALATAIAGAIGATAAGAVAGGVFGYLKDQGVPEYAAMRMEDEYTAGRTVMIVSRWPGDVLESEIVQTLSKYGGTFLPHERPAVAA